MPSFSRRRAIDWWKGGAVLWWDMCDGRRSGKGSPCGAVRWETGRCACWRAVGGWIGGYSAGCGRRRRPMADAGVRYAAAPPEWAALLLPLRLPAPVALRRAMLGQLVDCACRQLGLCRSQASVVLRASRPDGAVTEAADLLARRVRYLSPQLGRGQRSCGDPYGTGTDWERAVRWHSWRYASAQRRRGFPPC